jgi:hypothetical protein
MRSLLVLVAALATFGCSPAVVRPIDGSAAIPALPARSNTHDASRDAKMEFLLASAAADFQSHPPGGARLRFQNVRLGYLATSADTPRYMLCGTFSSDEPRSRAETTTFVTVDSPGGPNGYQQLLGANSMCADPAATFDGASDLSAALQSRFDSIASARR